MKKTESVKKLIHMMALQEEALNLVLKNFTKTAANIAQKDVDVGAIVDKVVQTTREPDFLDPCVAAFDAILSEEEINDLLAIYGSPTMKKLSTDGKDLLKPVYTLLSKQVHDLVHA